MQNFSTDQSEVTPHNHQPIRWCVAYLAWSVSAWTSWQTSPAPPGRHSPRGAGPAGPGTSSPACACRGCPPAAAASCCRGWRPAAAAASCCRGSWQGRRRVSCCGSWEGGVGARSAGRSCSCCCCCCCCGSSWGSSSGSPCHCWGRGGVDATASARWVDFLDMW